eukprot:RCo037778
MGGRGNVLSCLCFHLPSSAVVFGEAAAGSKFFLPLLFSFALFSEHLDRSTGFGEVSTFAPVEINGPFVPALGCCGLMGVRKGIVGIFSSALGGRLTVATAPLLLWRELQMSVCISKKWHHPPLPSSPFPTLRFKGPQKLALRLTVYRCLCSQPFLLCFSFASSVRFCSVT